MNNLVAMIKISIACGILAAGALVCSPLPAAESGQDEARRDAELAELEQRRHDLLAAIEASRFEAERAAAEARDKAVELRFQTERIQAEAELMRNATEADREKHRQEMRRMRDQLSRTHRELREASQAVARAHRELSLAENRRMRAQLINLGDRKMLGVVLGDVTEDGIRIVGLSPDGPAENAGLQTGDILVSLRGEQLGGSQRSARETVFEVLSDLEDGEEIQVEVLRDDERRAFMVAPEAREPASWASFIRIPGAPTAPSAPSAPSAVVAPAAPSSPRLVLPPLDVAELAAEAEALAHELDTFRIRIEGEEGDPFVYEYNYEFDPEAFEFDGDEFVEITDLALNDARFWFGGSGAHGIRFAELNEGLKGYFGADRGVLVLDARDDNPFGLQAGDVVLKVGKDEVNATSDIIRALRDIDAGESFEIAIKRKQRDESLEVVMPENRLGMLHERLLQKRGHAPFVPAPDNG